MKLVSDFYNIATSFKTDENGSLLPTTAIVLTALALSAGAAVDYSRYAHTKNVMDTALDAAILDAGVRLGRGDPVNQEFEDNFNSFFNANIIGRGRLANIYEITEFTANEETGQISATARADLNTTLMRLGGFGVLDVTSSSSGVFAQNATEVTIMLDSTGSMQGSRIRALRLAASEAVDILLDSSQTRVGIVPYASSVNAHRYASRATTNNRSERVASLGAFPTPNFNVPTNGCVTERGGREAATDASFTDVPVGSDRRSVQNSRNSLRCPSSRILPLTNNGSELKREISNLRAQGFTAGHMGIAWSYYMLSPKWNNLWDTQNEAADYSSDVNKVAILMTDGIFNTAYTGIGNGENAPFNNGPSRTRSQQLAASLCDNMKNSGIIVYSIAFELDNDDARDLLDNCATDDTQGRIFFYRADNENELREAFRGIARDISTLRLSQ